MGRIYPAFDGHSHPSRLRNAYATFILSQTPPLRPNRLPDLFSRRFTTQTGWCHENRASLFVLLPSRVYRKRRNVVLRYCGWWGHHWNLLGRCLDQFCNHQLGGNVGGRYFVYFWRDNFKTVHGTNLTIAAAGISVKPGAAEPSPNANHSGVVLIDTATNLVGIVLGAPSIILDGFTNYSFRVQNCASGIMGSQVTNCTVRYMTISNTLNSGISIGNTHSGLLEWNVLRNTGIEMAAGQICLNLSGSGDPVGSKVIRYNDAGLLHCDGIGGEGGTTIYGNKVFKITPDVSIEHPDGIVVQGGRNRIFLNEIGGFEQQIYLDAVTEPGTNNWVWSNVAHTNSLGANNYGIVVHAEYYNIEDVRIFNNTITIKGLRTVSNGSQKISNLYISNNIVYDGFDIEVP